MGNNTNSKLLSRRDMLRLSIAGIGGLALGNSVLANQSDDKIGSKSSLKQKINVLFINTDQQRFDAMSCAGSPYISTPNLDRLAREGVRFTSAFTCQPECSPARACFHTGLSVHTSGCTINTRCEADNLRFGSGSFDQNLAKLGYHTEHHGRWHAPPSLADCYENEVTLKFVQPYQRYLRERYGIPSKPGPGQGKNFISGHPYTPDLTTAELGNSPHKDFNIQYGVCSLPTDHTFTGFIANQTIDAIKRLRDEPFSITSAYLSPHHPWYVSEPFANSISPDSMDLPASMYDKRQNTPYVQNGWQLDDVELKHMKLFRARYFELIAEVDYHVGRILRTLDQLGLAENTLIIFTADHGEMLGEHGLTQKFVPYQASIRVPFIMRLPGKIPAGRIVDHPVNTLDIFATIFDYLGFPCPEQEGRSLRALIDGKQDGHPGYTFTELGWPGSAYTLFVSNRWKYVWYENPNQMDLLYDLEKDPHEMENLLGENPDRRKHISKAKEIRKEMLTWMDHIYHPFRDKLAKSDVR
ncbi:MAG: sulfatase-like hydrolase/transferase [Armatimonadota bacterium]